jgi:hypothetical protein
MGRRGRSEARLEPCPERATASACRRNSGWKGGPDRVVCLGAAQCSAVQSRWWSRRPLVPFLGVLSGQSDPGNNFSQASHCPGKWLLQGSLGRCRGTVTGSLSTCGVLEIGALQRTTMEILSVAPALTASNAGAATVEVTVFGTSAPDTPPSFTCRTEI